MDSPSGRPWLAHYPPGVPRSLEVPSIRLPELVEESVRRWPARPAMLFYGARWSYAELWELSGRFAGALGSAGIRPNDRVALHLPNCPAYPIAFLATLRLGATVVQVSPLYVGDDLRRLVADAEPGAIVTLDILYPNLQKAGLAQGARPIFLVPLRDLYPRLKRPFVNFVLRRRGFTPARPRAPHIQYWRPALGSAAPVAPVTGDAAQSVAVLQYTGGTTGTAKAAMLTHRNLVANALQCRAWFALGDPGTGTCLATVPFFHVYGMTVALTYPLIQGASIAMQLRPEPGELLELIRRYRPTDLPGVPAIYLALTQHPKVGQYDLRSIRVCVSGSAPLPVDLARRFEELTGGYLIEGYGLTEASPVTHANPIHGERRVGSIGVPLPGTDQRVVDPKAPDQLLGTGEVGELQVRGPQVMLGYYRHPEESAQVLHDGWLSTGDLARLDADGYCYIVDRLKDMINVGGLKVYPREVEEVLHGHPDISEAAVFGVSDPQRGEVVQAAVVCRPGHTTSPEALIAYLRERLAHYKVPRQIEFRASLPRSHIQKVLKRDLRAEVAEGSATSHAAAGPG